MDYDDYDEKYPPGLTRSIFETIFKQECIMEQMKIFLDEKDIPRKWYKF